MYKLILNPLFFILFFVGSSSHAIDTVKINEKDALFKALKNTSPVITATYIGWNKGWKYASTTLKTDFPNQTNPLEKGSFTGQVKDLGLDFKGDISISNENLTWHYNWEKSKDIADSTGFGIEFQLNQQASLNYSKPFQEPVLLANNQGWYWNAPDGQIIEVVFKPALRKLHFEKGNKGIIRAFFFAEMTKGSQQTTMTVKTANKNKKSQKFSFKGPDSLAYSPVNSKTWHKNILSPSASPVDLSFLNEKPAGKHGFIKREKDALLFGNGTPAKFWGANIQAYPLFKSSDIDVKKHAKRIAQLGFNLIRIHHHDSKWVSPNIFKNPKDNTLELSDSSLKKLDWWIKCLKDEGIYIWLDLHVGRTFTKNDGIPHFSDFSKGSFDAEAKGFNYLNKDIQQAMQAFNAAYLTHINQYTKLAYKDDPAVMALLITNENELTRHFGNSFLADKNVPHHNALFEDDANAFANKHKLAANKVKETWLMGESKIYLSDVEHRFNESMINHLKQLGTQSLIATTNSWGGMGVSGLPSLTDGSIIDTHSYGRAEEINFNPRFTPGFLTWIGAAQVPGYPLSTTEWNIEPFPARDRFLTPTHTASIASLQGWDAIMLYGYSQDALNGWQRGSNYSSYNDPAIIGIMPVAALLYRQDHVAQAQKNYELKLNRNDFFFINQDPSTSKSIRTLLETSRLTVAIPKTPELPWLNEHLFSSSDPQTMPVTDPNIDFIPPNQNFVESDTGELKRDWVAGIQTINTAKSQIASGWIGDKEIQLDAVTFNIKTKKAIASVQSLENKAISKSKKLFITLLARAITGKNNALPFLSEPINGKLMITAPAGLQLYPVNRMGNLENPIKLPYDKGQYTFTLSVENDYHWWILKP